MGLAMSHLLHTKQEHGRQMQRMRRPKIRPTTVPTFNRRTIPTAHAQHASTQPLPHPVLKLSFWSHVVGMPAFARKHHAQLSTWTLSSLEI
ncbi:hypothetical protein SeMB42_g03830 [Synchytrium endobioticum]|uniref:Uncharacterized protein n=1 Tax=Synchytrium endobioticum TaxID=286115 RepID=A0A507D3W6_9FUNG|nr:hypothetical protein SeMB42_g03830 [Synchytrium endobioticum]